MTPPLSISASPVLSRGVLRQRAQQGIDTRFVLDRAQPGPVDQLDRRDRLLFQEGDRRAGVVRNNFV